MVQAAHLTRQVLFSYFSCYVWLCNPMNCSMPHATLSLTISQSLLRIMSSEAVIPSNHLILYCPLSLCSQYFPVSGSFPMSQIFPSGDQSIGASASVLPMNIQGWFPLGLTSLTSLLSQESSPAPQFKSIGLLYGPTLTSVHDYWKSHSFDYMDIYWQSDVSAF